MELDEQQSAFYVKRSRRTLQWWAQCGHIQYRDTPRGRMYSTDELDRVAEEMERRYRDRPKPGAPKRKPALNRRYYAPLPHAGLRWTTGADGD